MKWNRRHPMSRLVFYISSHGFGHATREIEIINHLPLSVEVEVVTTVPEWLFRHSIPRPFDYFALAHDPGIVQRDVLTHDAPRTAEAWRRLLETYPKMARDEAVRIAARGVKVIIGDVSPFAVAVAEAIERPSVIVANFGWGWIFSAFIVEYQEFIGIIQQIAAYYRRTDLLLRTPLSGDLSVFPSIQDIPLVVRRSKRTRREARQALGLDEQARVVLLTFGGQGFQAMAGGAFGRYRDVTFITFDERFRGEKNVRWVEPRQVYHPDLVRASDLVLTKLGYGIVTECVAHQVPMAYPPRTHFPEHDVLERETPRYVPLIPMALDDFMQGNWDFLLDFFAHGPAHPAAPPPDDSFFTGGSEAARILCEALEEEGA